MHIVRHRGTFSVAFRRLSLIMRTEKIIKFMNPKKNSLPKIKWLEEDLKTKNKLLNAIGAGLSLIDSEMKIVWANKILEKWFGKLEKIKGKFCYKTYQRRDHVCPGCPSCLSFKYGKMQMAETSGFNTKGERRDFLLTTVPIFEGSKKPKFVLELTQDITNKKSLERRLVESENKLKNIFENINAAIFVISPDYRFSYLNPKAGEFFQIQPGAEPRCCDIFSPNRKWMGCTRCQLREAFEGKKTLYYEFSYHGRTYSSMLTPILDDRGNVMQLIEISLDISDFKDLEDKFKDSEELATIGKITAGVAHEIRNPIFGISSITQILARKELDVTEKEKLSQAMLFETERLNDLLEDLLILSSRKVKESEKTNPHAVIQDLLAAKEIILKRKSLRVFRKFNKTGRRFNTDARQLKLLFQNLIDNAIEASRKKGTIHLYTGYSGNREKPEFIFKIKNSGDYISKDEMNKIFEPFYSKKTQGTGLGLSICKRIVKDMKGSISVKSSKQRTEFEVTIPV
jgi:two-component system, NtrC family, nitrogen regulation sensor histidine kinase GlnL